MAAAISPAQIRTPYFVSYYDQNGQKQVLKRIPPVQQHSIRVEDEVTISVKKNDDWFEGKDAVVKSINPRQPNTLTIEDDDGKTTFVPYFDVTHEDEERPGEFLDKEQTARDGDAYGSKYLLWP